MFLKSRWIVIYLVDESQKSLPSRALVNLARFPGSLNSTVSRARRQVNTQSRHTAASDTAH
eukprot:3013172-Pyramimonas_sp.AAC.1